MPQTDNTCLPTVMHRAPGNRETQVYKQTFLRSFIHLSHPTVEEGRLKRFSVTISSRKVRYITMAAAVTASMQPKSMTRAKKWDEAVENAYRFQLAGYRDEEEYRSVKKVDSAEKWDNGFVKKLQRKDGCFYYYNKARECSDKDVPKTKLYNY